MKVIHQGFVYRAEKGTDHQSCIFPMICVLPSGRWLCSFRVAPTKNSSDQNVFITWSDDEGESWSTPIRPWSDYNVNGKPGRMRAAGLTAIDDERILAALMWVDRSEPDLPFFNEETEGLLDCRIPLCTSVDGGETWSEPYLVDTSPFDIPTPITGPILRLPNHELALQFELNKHYYDPQVWRHSSVMMFSDDEGKTWPEHVITSNDPSNRIFYWDQRPNVLSDGTLLNLFWTYDNKAGKYLNIHARESFDNGRTWSQMWDTGIAEQPAQPVSLPDNKVAAVYVDRSGVPAIKMRVSCDRGRSWPEETEVMIFRHEGRAQTRKKSTMQDAWQEMGKYSVGLPAAVSIGNGDILAVYYAGEETDYTSICWARITSG